MTQTISDQLFHALGDPTRRQLFELLAREGEQNVRDLTNKLPVSQPMISRHLGVLRQAGLVFERRSGREHHFSVNSQGLMPLADWMTRQGHFWNERLDALDALLGTIDN